MKQLAALLLVLLMTASPAMAGGDIKVSGAVELQYRTSSDRYATQGDDKFKAEELYVRIEKEIADNLSAMIMLDAADMQNNETSDRFVEEAQVIFKNIAGVPLDLYIGKDEMPWIQDYERFLFSSRVHGMEVDKVNGAHGQYKIDGFGSFDLAFYEREAKAKKYNVSWAESMTAKLTADGLADNLSISLGYMKEGRDEGVESGDKRGTSVAAMYKWNDLGVHAEIINTTAHDGSENDIYQVGADYRIGAWLIKGRYETDDTDPDKGDEIAAAGVTYYIGKNAYIVVEYEKEQDNDTETMIGFKAEY